MKNKIAKPCALFIIFVVGFSSLNGIAIAANNQVSPTGDAQEGQVNNITNQLHNIFINYNLCP